MKKIITAFLLIISCSVFSQSFSLNELIKLANSSDDYFDTYVTKKGYTFNEIKDREYSKSIGYTFLVNGYSEFFVSKILWKTRSFGFVTFQTDNISNYLKIKEDLINFGYKLSEKGTTEGFPYFEYKKGNTNVTLHLISETNEYTNKKRNAYEIAVKTNYIDL
jgi:hypothetical protein